jgi:superfamily II DNA or RNA helicase
VKWTTVLLDPSNVNDYRLFCKIKRLPAWKIEGRVASFPAEYAAKLNIETVAADDLTMRTDLHPQLFDYQRDLARMAIDKRKFAVFADCGLGKSMILLSYAREVAARISPHRRVLIITPPMVVRQLASEAKRFFGETDLPTEIVTASTLQGWLDTPGNAIGITNYEALKKTTEPGRLGALVLDESSILKSHYGNYASILLRLGKGLDWKLCATGTPAPNDRIEYANHAVFLDRFPTINSFLAKYFVNRGQTEARWELKPHALRPFYRSLSDWCIFLTDPSVYGWRDNCGTLPPIRTHIEHVELTQDQRDWVNTHLRSLVATRAGGITSRGAYGQVAKGHWKGQRFETNKPQWIRDKIATWSGTESTLVWCLYDDEQSGLAEIIPDSESLSGATSVERRVDAVERFKSGEARTLISKPRILGFGLNLQVATRQVFSGLQDSYEAFYQCVKRSNRVGSTKPLDVHIPVTELEEPMVENVLRKAHRVEADTKEQELLFREVAAAWS